MKRSKKLLTAAVSALMLTAPGTILITPEVASFNAKAIDDTGDDWLHAKGSRLYDMNGNEVWLTGANWFGYNCTECALHYL